MLKVSCIGFGGAGINQLNTLVDNSKLVKKLGKQLDVMVVDTSSSNPVSSKIIDNYILGTGLGSGKDRAENATAAMNALPNLLNRDSDVFVLISSSSGGTGDIMSNIAAAKLLKSGKIVVKISITHTNSFANTQNTIKAFSTLEKVCANHYMGVMIFDNTEGRKPADECLQRDLELMLTTLCVDYQELDDADKKRFLVPSEIVGPHAIGFYDNMLLGPIGEELPSDTKGVSMSDNQFVIPDDRHIPSILSINDTGDIESKFSMFEDFVGVSSVFKMTALNGAALSTDYLTYLKESMDRHKRVTHTKTTFTALADDNSLEDALDL